MKTPDIRYLEALKSVLYDQQWAKTAPNLEAYYMYRGLKYDDGLRYDITIIPFQLFGKELPKTKGHEHPNSFAELYEVLEGRGIFLMQKWQNAAVTDVYAVKAKKGDKIFIPAHYGHVTVNPGPDNLKMSNWVAENFKSDYSLLIEKQGACYYALQDNGEVKWVKNEKYDEVPELTFKEPDKDIPANLKKALMGE